jgi:PAS domain S-box-containing protein
MRREPEERVVHEDGTTVNVPKDDLQAVARSIDPWAFVSAVLANSPHPLQVCDGVGTSVYVNEAYRRTFRHSPGRGWNVLRDPGPLPDESVALLRHAFAGEAVTIPACWSRSDDGDGPGTVYAGLQAYPLRNTDRSVALVVLQFEDCTRQQISLDEQNRLLAERDAVLEQSPQGIVICDINGRYRLFNRAASRLWGGSREVRSMADWTEFRAYHKNGTPFAPEDWPLARSLRAGVVVEAEEIQFERFDGRRGTMLAASAPLCDAEGRVVGGVGVFTDLTQFRELEKLRDRFIALASHELRTPLTTLLGYTQLLVRRLQRGEAPNRLQSSAASILQAGRRLDRLVNQLVDVSRLDQGVLTLRREPCDLTAVARRVIEEIGSREADARIELDAPDQLVGDWDAGRVEQALYNLLDNAAKYGLPERPILLRLRDQADGASVSVDNEGEPLEEAAIARLFDRYSQAEAREQRPVGGLGLGLYMAREIVLAHGGSITAAGRPGGGLSVTFTLPRGR